MKLPELASMKISKSLTANLILALASFSSLIFVRLLVVLFAKFTLIPVIVDTLKDKSTTTDKTIINMLPCSLLMLPSLLKNDLIFLNIGVPPHSITI